MHQFGIQVLHRVDDAAGDHIALDPLLQEVADARVELVRVPCENETHVTDDRGPRA